MGKSTPKQIPAGYEAFEGRKYQIFDVPDGPGENQPRDITLDEYNTYKGQQKTQSSDDEGGEYTYTTGPKLGTRLFWDLQPIKGYQPPGSAPAPAPTPAPAPAPTAPAQAPAPGGPQPSPVSAPATPAAPQIQQVTPHKPVYGSDAQAAASAGPAFGTQGRRPFRKAPQQLGATEALTKKRKLGG